MMAAPASRCLHSTGPRIGFCICVLAGSVPVDLPPDALDAGIRLASERDASRDTRVIFSAWAPNRSTEAVMPLDGSARRSVHGWRKVSPTPLCRSVLYVRQARHGVPQWM